MDDGRPRKRNRVKQSCDVCRDRKTRCDGRHPTCLACESRGVSDSCQYTYIPRRQRRSSSQAPISSPPGQTQSTATIFSSKGLAESNSGSQSSVDKQTIQDLSSAQSDGLATLTGSNDAFLRHVIARGSRTGSVTPSRQKSSVAQNEPVRTAGENGDPSVIPRRRNADDYLNCYWEFVHSIFPILHKPTFVEKYERLWTSDSGETGVKEDQSDLEDTIFMSTLNLVFALGSKYSTFLSPAQRGQASDEFFQRHRRLFNLDVLDSASIPIVQMLLVSGMYLQSTQHASRCWNSVGLAIRVAQSLGLHVDRNNRREGSQLEREMRRRIWHTCKCLDRLLAMTFGRPTMTKPTDVPIPAMIDDKYLRVSGEGTQPKDTPSRLGLLVYSCKLFELLEEVLNFLSDIELATTTNRKDGDSQLVKRVLHLNRQLDDFSTTVPRYLQMSNSRPLEVPTENHVHLQQQVLYCRFLLTRLLLLRPLLLLSTKRHQSTSTTQPTLDDEIIKHCCELCSETAYHLIETIHDNIGTLYRSSGWHAVYFTFSAAIVLVASLKCPQLNTTTRLGDANFEASWRQCITILEHYKDQIHSAPHAVVVIKAMREQILSSQTDPLPPVSTETNFAGPAVEQQQSDLWWSTFQLDPPPGGLFGFDDAWFGQQLTNLDWLELPEL